MRIILNNTIMFNNAGSVYYAIFLYKPMVTTAPGITHVPSSIEAYGETIACLCIKTGILNPISFNL